MTDSGFSLFQIGLSDCCDVIRRKQVNGTGLLVSSVEFRTSFERGSNRSTNIYQYFINLLLLIYTLLISK